MLRDLLAAALLICLVSQTHSYDDPNSKIFWFTSPGGGHHRARYDNYAQVSMESALSCCQDVYHPVVLFSSGDGIEIVPSWAQTLHDNCVIEVVHHNLSFVDRIMDHISQPRDKSFYDGEAMRMDIPNIIGDVAKKIEKRCGLSNGRPFSVERALYTDTDIIMYKPVSIYPQGGVAIGVGPEHEKGITANNGVMTMNVTAFKLDLPKLLDFGDTKDLWLTGASQAVMMQYYRTQPSGMQLLPDEYNWKPYWGKCNDDDVHIVHFHGAKYGVCSEQFQYYRFNIPELISEMERRKDSTCQIYFELLRFSTTKYNITYQEALAGYSYYSAEVNMLMYNFEKRLRGLGHKPVNKRRH